MNTRSDIQAAYERLLRFLEEHPDPLIAYSGGTDSTFLVWAARQVLGHRMLAVTLVTPYMFRHEVGEAEDLCRQYDIPHEKISLPMSQALRNNPEERCYLCKHMLFSKLLKKAEEEGRCCVMEGTHADDLTVHRPGRKALHELGIISPLAEAGLTKEAIRTLSREAGLPTWEKPSNSCLLTRFPYGHRITENNLTRVEKAETFLRGRGYSRLRVRNHGALARLEIPIVEMGKILQPGEREKITEGLKSLGYHFVTLDLVGLRSGSFDQVNSTKGSQKHEP